MRVCTLIPAYKPAYLHDLLTSLANQTRRPDCVIFSDDSPDGAYQEALTAPENANCLSNLDWKVIQGPRQGAWNNAMHLVRAWAGRTEAFHLFLDDDLLYPHFYETHLRCLSSGLFSCSISRRWECDESGVPVKSQPFPAAVEESASRFLSIDSNVAFKTTIGECKNWFGEFSNAIFTADCAGILLQPQLAGISFAGLWDLGAFAAASIRKPICYIQENLGGFRRHGDQNSSKPFGPMMKAAVIGYVALIISGWRLRKIDQEQAKRALANMSLVINQWYGSQEDVQHFAALVSGMTNLEPEPVSRFESEWGKFLSAQGF